MFDLAREKKDLSRLMFVGSSAPGTTSLCEPTNEGKRVLWGTVEHECWGWETGRLMGITWDGEPALPCIPPVHVWITAPSYMKFITPWLIELLPGRRPWSHPRAAQVDETTVSWDFLIWHPWSPMQTSQIMPIWEHICVCGWQSFISNFQSPMPPKRQLLCEGWGL